MARYRTVKPEFWTDSKTGTLTSDAAKLFLGMLNHCDDFGVIRWDSMEFKARIFPYDSRDVANCIDAFLLKELLPRGLVTAFSVDQTPFLHIVNFEKHQKVDKPGKPLIKGWKTGTTPVSIGLEPEHHQSLNEEQCADDQISPPIYKDDSGNRRESSRTFDTVRARRECKGVESNTTPLPPTEPGNGKKTPESVEPPQDSDLMVKVLLEAHPKIQSPVRAEQEAVEAIKRESPQCGGMKEAYRYLLVRTRLYKIMTDKWPAEEKNFIVGAPKFFKECVYRLDEKEWVKHNPNAPPAPVERESLISITNRALRS